MDSSLLGKTASERSKTVKGNALSFFSPAFDPILALSSPDFNPPMVVNPLDNVAACWKFFPNSKGKEGAQRKAVNDSVFRICRDLVMSDHRIMKRLGFPTAETVARSMAPEKGTKAVILAWRNRFNDESYIEMDIFDIEQRKSIFHTSGSSLTNCSRILRGIVTSDCAVCGYSLRSLFQRMEFVAHLPVDVSVMFLPNWKTGAPSCRPSLKDLAGLVLSRDVPETLSIQDEVSLVVDLLLAKIRDLRVMVHFSSSGIWEVVKSPVLSMLPSRGLERVDAIAGLCNREVECSCFVARARNGPLSVLHNAFLRKGRVHVFFRGAASMIGSITGWICAYDKHFNMLLFDCVEEISTPHPKNEGRKNGSFPTVPRSRTLHCLLLRGDSVVSVREIC